jgi:hypothetical protein
LQRSKRFDAACKRYEIPSSLKLEIHGSLYIAVRGWARYYIKTTLCYVHCPVHAIQRLLESR